MKLATLFLLGVISCAAHAQTGAVSSAQDNSQFQPWKGDGFYWYAKPPADPVKKEEEKEKPAAAPGDKPKKPEPLSMKWLAENLQPLLQKAADTPSRDNVANYFYAQRILLDKSQNFSTSAAELIASDPFLDENNRMPIAQFATLEWERQASRNTDAILKLLAQRGGIWLFTDKPDKCTACKKYETDIIGGTGSSGVAKEFGFSYRVIDVSTKNGRAVAQKLKLKVTPTTVFVAPPNKFVLLSQGLMSQDSLKTRIVVGARVAGLLSPDEASMTLPYSKGILKNDDIQAETEGKDPSDVMRDLRERIQSK